MKNPNSRFAINPVSIDVPRSQFKRDSSHQFTGVVGKLIPFYLDEVLPGDSFKVKTACVVRFNTFLHPVMANIYCDIAYFFVPNRIIWDKWKEFCGESPKAWLPEVEYEIPQISCDSSNPHPGVGSLADYLGVPLSYDGSYDDPKPDSINALPFRAYAKICSDWYRSEALQDELVIPTDSSPMVFNAIDDDDLYCAYGGPLFGVGRFQDYFSAALPSPQCGPSVKIPVDAPDYAPVLTRDQAIPSMSSAPLTGILKGTGALGNNSSYPLYGYHGIVQDRSVSVFADSNAAAGVNGPDFIPRNLWAQYGVTVGTISELRMAFQVQKYYEKLNGGRRYIEVLKSMFGVTSPDARLQRSEYLGGKRFAINVSEVTANAKSEGIDVGDLAGMSRTTDVSNNFVHSFTEHGYVLGVMCVRFSHTYGQGLDRHFLRKKPFDYFWPVFSNISNQPIYCGEIHYTHNTETEPYDVFGYGEAWGDYRFKRNTVAGYLRPEAPLSLASWNLADYYDPERSGPFLSAEWLKEDAGVVDRTLAVSTDLTHQFIADFYVNNICTRVMPMYSIPGLADHH